MTEKKPFSLIPYLFVFLATFLILQLFAGPTEADPELSTGDLGIKAEKNEFVVGKEIQFEVQNNTTEELTLYTYNCTGLMFELQTYTSSGFVSGTPEDQQTCEGEAYTPFVSLAPGGKESLNLSDYSYTYFGEPGRYRLGLYGGTEIVQTEVTEETEPNPAIMGSEDLIYTSPEFEVREPGMITKLWRSLLYQPILNALIALIVYIPNHNLALAVILLTIVIRTILLAPSQKSFDSQRKMQEIQPKIEAIKKKYKDDQARIAQETMGLWKSSGVHPASSCLPLLIQFPILIALFYVVQNGLSPDKAVLIYDFIPEFSLTNMNSMFFGFDILERSRFVFPIAIGVLQFGQMQLLMAKRKKKTDDKKKKDSSMPKEMEQANKMMKYLMPVMIAFFATQMPAAVSLYWGTSTFYGIIQQLVLKNRGPVTSNDKEDVKIRVINKDNGKTN